MVSHLLVIRSQLGDLGPVLILILIVLILILIIFLIIFLIIGTIETFVVEISLVIVTIGGSTWKVGKQANTIKKTNKRNKILLSAKRLGGQVVSGQVNGAKQRKWGRKGSRVKEEGRNEEGSLPVSKGRKADLLAFVEHVVQGSLLNLLRDQGAKGELLLLHSHSHAGPGSVLGESGSKCGLERERERKKKG